MIDLAPEHLETVRRILAARVPDCEVRAFGSRVTWTAKDYSDLDLAVVGDSALDPDRLRQLREDFEESGLPIRVDVIDWHAISPEFRNVIAQQYEVIQEGTISGIGDDWHERTLGELTENFDGIRAPIKESDRRVGPYPYYGASGTIDHVDEFLLDGEYLLISEDGENLRTRTTPVAFLARGKFWVNNHAHVVRGNGEADTRFLMYALSASDIGAYLTGSTIPKLTQGNMNRIPLLTPALPEQRAIAHVLGTLDDKIELNRRMNETLEAMAQALFKSWFVDFDPVRAKAEGRDPGLPRPLADLFPARLVDSELGEIPDGWEVKALGDLLELAYGKALKAEDRRDGTIPVYGSNGQVGWHEERLVVGPGIVVGRKGNPGIVTWVSTDFYCIDTTFYVVPKPNCRNLEFLFHALRTHDLGSLGADSAVPGLNRNLAYMSSQLLPPVPLLQQFGRIARALSRRVECGSSESRTLAAQRDSILPQLISGQLRVHVPEKFIGRGT